MWGRKGTYPEYGVGWATVSMAPFRLYKGMLSEPRVTKAERFSAGLVVLEPGKGHDSHNHPGVEEILYVLSGVGRQVVDAAGGRIEREVGPGVLIHIPPDVFHSTVNIGAEPLELLAVYAPPGPEVELRATEGVVIEPPRR